MTDYSWSYKDWSYEAEKDSMKKYQLMIDPTPAGWAYGFPRALPEEAVMGKGSDLWIKNDFDLTEWVCSFGYPEESFQYYKLFPQEIEEYVYPGSDCQE
jgi:hypothetical protein